MLDALLNVLNGLTDIPFVEFAWSHSPDDKYGVITLDNQIALNTDADPVTEKMLSGFVDVFVKKPQDLSTVNDVESALKQLGIWFALESVQFEDDTGYVHYEWQWRDSISIVTSDTYVARFFIDDVEIADPQIVVNNDVVFPNVQGYVANGITYIHTSWKSVYNRGNINYIAKFGALLTIRRVSSDYFVMNGSNSFTETQINAIVDWFASGNDVVCSYNGINMGATSVTSENVKFKLSPTLRVTALWG